jgi:signal peptidase II
LCPLRSSFICLKKMSRYRIFALTAVIVLLADQASKIYIDSRFAIGESLPVLDNFFHIAYVRNPGAAFGMLANSSIRVPFFLSVSAVAAVAILWYLTRVEAKKVGQQAALGLIFSGAVGNMIDRARLGEVIDFVYVHWYEHFWPAFNVADSAICVGVVIMLICSWHEEKHKQK